MTLDNDQIEAAVRRVTGILLKDHHPKPHEEECIQAGVSLVINLLQNINDIAYCAINADQRADR